MKRPFGRGPITRSLGDLRSPWLLTTETKWDDPPRTPKDLEVFVFLFVFCRALFMCGLGWFDKGIPYRNHRMFFAASMDFGTVIGEHW